MGKSYLKQKKKREREEVMDVHGRAGLEIRYINKVYVIPYVLKGHGIK